MCKAYDDENIGKKFDSGTDVKEVEDFFLGLIRNDDKFVFRGESKKDEIYPTIMRNNEYHYIENEWELLERFEKYGANYYHVYGAIDFLACAQHYGLPTRLLDFTYNPFVALAFALRGDNPEGDYYIVRYCKLTDNMTVDSILHQSDKYVLKNQQYETLTGQIHNIIEFIDEERKVGKKEIEIEKIETHGGENISLPINPIGLKKDISSKLVFVETVQSNARIIVQQGLFMLTMDLEVEKYLQMIHKNTRIVKVHKSLRMKLLDELSILGCDMFHLMPDLASICDNIKRGLIKRDIGRIQVIEHGVK